MIFPRLSCFIFVILPFLIIGCIIEPNNDTFKESDDKRIVLSSSTFVFTLDTADGLRAISWKNRLTGQELPLGANPEISFDIGLPDQVLLTPKLKFVDVSEKILPTGNETVFLLESPDVAASVKVVYRWNDKEPVLHKFVTITNTGNKPWDRLLNIRLGEYDIGDAALSGGELKVYPPSFKERAHRIGGLQGFPVYVNDEFFLSLAHPAGWATQQPGQVSLRHYPGVMLQPGQSRECMEAVYGVGPAGQGRTAFLTHIKSRMRRVVRGHDRPYAIFEPFGGRTEGSVDDSNRTVDAAFASGHRYEENEPFLLDMIDKITPAQKTKECQFEFLSIDFWVDNKGDIKQADPDRFPNQFDKIKAALDRAGIKPALWIDSSFCGWSVGGNPATKPAIVQDVAPDFFDGDAWKQWGTQAYFCRATEPVRSMYRDSFLYHIRENGVRWLKFDNFNSQCSNPAHDHLPGVYGNEATHDAVIECYQAFDAACPDVLITLYWGYRSPWWLLWADTIFETGVEMEAASPGHISALYPRDAVTRKLDQGRTYAKDVPAIGLDSLGIWLSHWGWNSSIGTERWQEGFVMDICRGHALAQPWTDPNWLTPPQRRQMGDFIALMKAQPACFTNSRPILGDPWKVEPYGYSCADGKRAFWAISNGTWQDHIITLQLNPEWDLPENKSWDIYRWYPNPAKLTGPEKGFNGQVQMAMCPFEVVLLEVVPHNQTPSLSRNFEDKALPTNFAHASRPVDVVAEKTAASPQVWTVTGQIPASESGGIFAVILDMTYENGTPFELGNIGSFFSAEATAAGSPIVAQPAIGTETYPSSWQTWRMSVPPRSTAQSFTLRITDLPGKPIYMNHNADAQRRFSAYFLPKVD